MSAVAKATMKKLGNGTISNVSVKTSAKIAISRCVEGALVSGTALGNLINVPPQKLQTGFLNNRNKKVIKTLIRMCICQLMSDRKNIIIEACIGIKIFTWTLVLLFTIPLVFLIFIIIKYSDYSPVYFYVIICIVLINFGLVSEMLGTKIIVSYDSIIIVKRFFQKNEIKIKDISGYKFTFMTCVKGEYPDNLKIYHKNLETNFNKGLCSKKDMQKLYSFFETNSIIRIK